MNEFLCKLNKRLHISIRISIIPQPAFSCPPEDVISIVGDNVVSAVAQHRGSSEEQRAHNREGHIQELADFQNCIRFNMVSALLDENDRTDIVRPTARVLEKAATGLALQRRHAKASARVKVEDEVHPRVAHIACAIEENDGATVLFEYSRMNTHSYIRRLGPGRPRGSPPSSSGTPVSHRAGAPSDASATISTIDARARGAGAAAHACATAAHCMSHVLGR